MDHGQEIGSELFKGFQRAVSDMPKGKPEHCYWNHLVAKLIMHIDSRRCCRFDLRAIERIRYQTMLLLLRRTGKRTDVILPQVLNYKYHIFAAIAPKNRHFGLHQKV